MGVTSPEPQAGVAAERDAGARANESVSKTTSSGGQQQGEREEEAAQTIQRHYRGYRERRQLKGMALDASTRWTEALKEARYLNATRPTSRGHRLRTSNPSTAARRNWRRVSEVARRAGADDPTDDDEQERDQGDGSLTPTSQPRHSSTTEDTGPSEEQRTNRIRQRQLAKQEREKHAKMMDLQYFLEMVDTKHRYGSNLRAYHSEWKKADTNENFFYWLDEGEGRNVEAPTVPRERLESERVRYLSREERLNYLVKIDKEGRLCWAKTGERITTSTQWKDSKDGIVRSEVDGETHSHHRHASTSTAQSRPGVDSSAESTTTENQEADHYINHDLIRAKGVKKLTRVSAATILNHLLRASVKPNTWIFVADTSFRLYVGIKQSGAFQHSSFLHGSRISAAGTIKIKDGQLRSLSPLSGHYRPPTKNFRAFVHNLRDAGVDMSRVSISKSYAVLVGLETYVKARKKLKGGLEHARIRKEKVVHPAEAKQRQEREKDKSKSAEKERQILAAQERREEETRREKGWRSMMWRKLGRMEKDSGRRKRAEEKGKVLSVPGQDPESAIAPEGKR